MYLDGFSGGGSYWERLGTSHKVSVCSAPFLTEMLTLGRVSGEGSHNPSTSTIFRGGDTEGQLFTTETVVLTADSTMSSLKGMFLTWEPTEKASFGIWFQPLPGALQRRGGPIARPEGHPLPEICMGEEGPGIELVA